MSRDCIDVTVRVLTWALTRNHRNGYNRKLAAGFAYRI